MKTKQQWSEMYVIPTPRQVSIGDSVFLEQIMLGTADWKTEKKIYTRKNIPKSYKARLIFRKEYIAEDLGPVYSVSIYVCHKDYIDTYASGSYYPSAVRQDGERILETESDRYKVVTAFHNMDAEGRTEYSAEFDFGVDGYIATAVDCVRPFGFLLTFDLPDTQTMSERAMRNHIAYLFRCPALAERGKH